MPAQQGFHCLSPTALQKHVDAFGNKLYGIGSGAPANLSLKEIIGKNAFGLGQWKLVESSEQAMLAQVQRAVQKNSSSPSSAGHRTR